MNLFRLRWLWMIVCLQFGLGLIITAVTPLWQEHEADYYTVTRFLTEYGRFPEDADYPSGDVIVRQATQPPLFFIAAAPIVALLDDRQPIPPGVQPGLVCIGGESANSTLIHYPLTTDYRLPVDGTILAAYGLRVLNLLFGVIAVVLTYLAGRILFPTRPFIALVGAALLAFEPNTLQVTTTIGNTALVLPLAAANLCCAALMFRGKTVRWRWAVPLIGFAILAVLTRLSGWAVFGLDVLIIGYGVGRTVHDARKHINRSQLRVAMIGLALLVIAGAGIALYNYSQFGSVFGRYPWLDQLVLRAVHDLNPSADAVIGVIEQTRISFESPLALLGPHRILLNLYSLAVLIALSGIGLALVQRWRRHSTPQIGSITLLAGAAAIAAALVLFRNLLNITSGGGVTAYNTAMIFVPIRYYDVGLPPMALLLSAGLMAWAELLAAIAGRQRSSHLARLAKINPFGVGMALIWTAVTILGIARLLHNHPTVGEIQPASLIAAQDTTTPAGAQAITAPRLLASAATIDSGNGTIDLAIQALSNAPMTLNYAAQIDMVSDGSVINSCQFLPVRGFVPTTLWTPNEPVTITAAIPNCAGPRTAPIDLRLRWLGANMSGVIEYETESVLLTTIETPLAQAPTCPVTLGILADGYRVTKFNSPSSVRTGETYLPSVNWIVTNPSDAVAERWFIFTHTGTGEQFICSVIDRAVSTWARGEHVYFDRCPMTFSPQASLGEYTVEVALIDDAGRRLPATGVATNDAVPVGIVTVTS